MKLLELISNYVEIDAQTEHFFKTQTITKDFEKNQILSYSGSFNRTVFFMDAGLARTYCFEKGKEITTNFYADEKIFANIDTIFRNMPAVNVIETLEPSTITMCDYSRLEKLCAVSLSAANFSRFILGSLMQQMSDRMTSLQFMTAKEKYLKLLQENPNIILRAPLGMIASYLGISQETLSRIRAEI